MRASPVPDVEAYPCSDNQLIVDVKLVVKISTTVLSDKVVSGKFASTITQLLADKHRIAIVHGGHRLGHQKACGHGTGLHENQQVNGEAGDLALMVLGGRVNKTLVCTLSATGIAAFGLCGGDGNIIRVRNTWTHAPRPCSTVEVASVDPQWLDAISSRGGVPVLASVGLGPDHQHYGLSSDQLAAACAIGWDADALIFLTGADGVKNLDGSVVRWLQTGNGFRLPEHLVINQDMRSKVRACYDVLSRGVRRARIIPLAQVDSLTHFYFERINYGTEVVLA